MAAPCDEQVGSGRYLVARLLLEAGHQLRIEHLGLRVEG